MCYIHFFCYCFYKLCRTAEQLDLFSRVSVDHTAQSRGTGSEAWVSQVSDNFVTWTVLLFFFFFLSTLNFRASAARIVIHCSMKKCPKAGISSLMLRDQSLAESRCQMALCETGNWEPLCLESAVCKCYPALGSYRALHTDTRTFFPSTASLPVLLQSTQQFPDQEMVAVVVGTSHYREPLCQPLGPPENTWICLMCTMTAHVMLGLPSAWPSTLGN